MIKNKKLFALISVIVIIASIGGAVTVAYLFDKSNGITNTFVNGKVGCEVEENITAPGVKQDVMLKNTGNADAYMRAYVVVNWIDKDGNVYVRAPRPGVDYVVNTPANYGFIADGNAYYCKEPVKAGEKSPVLFTSIAEVSGKAPEGYVLSVEILGSAIQSAPASAVKDAWGVKVAKDGTLALKED